MEKLKGLSRKLTEEENVVISIMGLALYKLIVKKRLQQDLRRRLESFQTKNKKLNSLAKYRKVVQNVLSYNVPIVNLSNVELTVKEKAMLSFGLNYSFVDKNKKTKSFLAAKNDFENVPESTPDIFDEMVL